MLHHSSGRASAPAIRGVGDAAPSRFLINPRSLIIAGVSIALFSILLRSYDLQQVRLAAAEIPLPTMYLVTLVLLTGTLLSCVRYKEVLAVLGIQVPMRLATHANLVGIVGGLMFFQVIGQTLARTAVLERHGVRGPAILFANIVERLTAMLWLSALMVCGVFYLFGLITLEALGGDIGEIKLVLVLALVAFAVGGLVCPRLVKLGLQRLTRGLRLGGLARVSAYSILTHQATLIAFVLLGHAVAPTVPILDLAAASLIVMFAASVPISFAGWGVREISAVYAYQAIGIPVEKALAVSILVGIISLLLVLAMSLASSVFSPRSIALHREAELRSAKASAGITRGLSLLVPLLCAALIFFQVHIPLAGGAVNVNLADPLAIGGGFIFLSRYLRMADRHDGWRVRIVELFVAAATIVLGLGLVLGWARFGLTDWALYNRFFGWFVLIGYAATGALIVGNSGAVGRTLLLRVVLLAGSAIAGAELVSFLLVAAGAAAPGLLPLSNLAGMAQNPNAFAIQMIAVLCIVCAGLCPLPAKSPSVRAVLSAVAFAIALLALYFARSRTGYIVTGAVVLLVLRLQFVSWRVVIGGVLGATALGLLIFVLAHQVLPWFYGPGGGAGASVFLMKLKHASSDTERMTTIVGGLQLWLANPVFGAGLGAFAEMVRAETGKVLVIHNTSVWMLAELGLVGFGLFAAFFAAVMRAAFRDATASDLGARVLLLLLCSAALFQLPHDIFYQRIYWLILGATLYVGRLPRLNG